MGCPATALPGSAGKIGHIWPRRLAAQDIALSRRRSPVRIRSGLPCAHLGVRCSLLDFLARLISEFVRWGIPRLDDLSVADLRVACERLRANSEQLSGPPG